MDGMLSAARALDRITRVVGKAAGWLILPLIAIIVFDVVTRKIDVTRLYFAEWTATSGISVSTVLQDMQWHLHAFLLMLTFGIGYLANTHVRVDVFREMMSRRSQAKLELFLLIVFAMPFLIAMVMYSWELFTVSWFQNEGSESMTGMGARYIVKSSMFIGFVIMTFAALATILRLIVDLYGSTRQQEAALAELQIFSSAADELEAARLASERALIEAKRKARH